MPGPAPAITAASRTEPTWRAVRAIPVGTCGSDIGHLVIGPGGVFTVNTKHHPGARVWVNGDTFLANGVHQPHVRTSRHEAQRAGDLLTAACGFPVRVRGVILPVRADKVVVREASDEVHVVALVDFAFWLQHRPSVLDSPTQDAVYALACRSTTWHPAHLA